MKLYNDIRDDGKGHQGFPVRIAYTLVLTIEPGTYISDGKGIRLEDMVRALGHVVEFDEFAC